MRKILNALSSFLSRLFKGGASSHPSQAAASTINFYTGNEKPLKQLIGDALDQNLNPILYFHADWCGGAVKFKASLSDPRMREALSGAMLIIIDSDNDPEGLSGAYHIRHVPAFVKVNRDGSAIKTTTGAEWGDDTIENMAPVMKRFLE